MPSTGDAGRKDEADFLRRLSVADAKVLLERTRKEKENKTKEMQTMIGVRYRDLIESADKIVNMHSAALRLEVSLKEMPDNWKRIEALVAKTLMESTTSTSATHELTDQREDGNFLPVTTGTNLIENTAFLVAIPEKMWQLLDIGESFQALQLFQQAEKIHNELDACKDVYTTKFPFLPSQWAYIQSFRSRMPTCAQTFLSCRGKESRFYAQNLCTLAVLDETSINADALFTTFLKSRSNWMWMHVHNVTDEDESQTSLAKQQHRLTVFLRTIVLTFVQSEEIFLTLDNEHSLMKPAFQMSPKLHADMDEFVSSGRLQKRLAEWFQIEQSKINKQVTPIIARINSISKLAQVQSKLCNADKKSGGCSHVRLWGTCISKSNMASQRGAGDDCVPQFDSAFAILFAEAFRKRTRDLVQNSFIEALEAIKRQIRSILGDINAATKRFQFQLSHINFYEHFETIHMKTANLNSSELQTVLTEEFMRTLFKLIVFLEEDYPLYTSDLPDVDSATGNVQTDDPILFLNVSNMLAGIVAGFSSRVNKLFPGSEASLTIKHNDRATNSIQIAFEKYAQQNRLSTKSVHQLLQDIHPESGQRQSHFIDEELKHAETLGFHSFYLLYAVTHEVSYPQIFVDVVQAFSKSYCESWAKILLHKKIAPLRELLQMEQYEVSNEEWLATHEGWVEQIISDEVLGSDDADDSTSETELAMGEEKVWLPWCETPTVSSFLFSCCYSLDEANLLVRSSIGAGEHHIALMHGTIRDVLVDQLTIVSVRVYNEAVSLLHHAKEKCTQKVINFGECCILQFLFDMYFVRATLGFSDFIRFGWGDELNPEECSPGLLKLIQLFERMKDYIDPVDWEIYGPQLIENVVVQFRKSRLLLSSLSESNDINEINGKEITISAQDTRPIVRIIEPVARFSLLPVPSTRRRLQRSSSQISRSSDTDSQSGRFSRSSSNVQDLFPEQVVDGGSTSLSSTLKLQNLLSSSTGSNLLSAAATGTNLLSSSAAKGMSFLSSATSSYLREGENRSKYF